MERKLLTWTWVNWLTVVLMAAVGYTGLIAVLSLFASPPEPNDPVGTVY